MQRSEGRKNRVGNTRGESMVLAVIVMLVFFALGAAVLTAASVAGASVNARESYRQAYYGARSTFDVLDASLQNGALGERVRNTELNRLLTAAAEGTGESIELTGVALPLPLSFTENGPQNLTFPEEGNAFTYDVVARFVPGTGRTQAFLSLQNAALSVSVECAGKSYGVRVTYQYAGWARLTDGVWIWTGEWKLRSIA